MRILIAEDDQVLADGLLRTLRASIIPLITIPVSLTGSFALMALFGFSINSLTLLALVLVVCYLVDRKTWPQAGLRQWMTLRFRLTTVSVLSCLLGAAAV